MDKTLQDTTLDSGPVYRIQTLWKNIRFAKPFRSAWFLWFFSTANVVHSSVPSDPFWLHLCCFPRRRKSSCNLRVSTHHESFFTRWGKIWLGWPPVTLHAAQHLRFLPKNFMLCYFFHVIICYNYVLFHDYSGRFSVPASSKSHFWAAARSAQSWICGSSRAGFGQPMATNHPPVSQKTSQKSENICKFKDPSMIFRSIENIFDRLPKNVWCFLLMNSMNYFRRLYPCESSQVFQVHCTCCTPWVKTKGCEKPPIKSETMKVQFCSSRVAPETCQEFVKWAKVICLQWAIDWGNRFNQMIAALQTETGYSNLLSLDKSIATLLSLGILLHPSSLSHKWTVLFLSPK